MPLVTVKPKFQVTIPAKLRQRIGLHEGDLLDATVVDDGILLRPKAVVDRAEFAGRLEDILRKARPSAEDAVRSEEEILRDVQAEVKATRRNRRR